MQLERERFAMQCGGQVDEIGVVRAGLSSVPWNHCRDASRCAADDMWRIVLQVVAHDERRAICAVAAGRESAGRCRTIRSRRRWRSSIEVGPPVRPVPAAFG